MHWDTANYTIEFNFSQCIETLDRAALKKKKMLSAISGVFDPLGIAAPVVITGKCCTAKFVL